MWANLSAVFADICDRVSESRLEAVCRATLRTCSSSHCYSICVSLCAGAHVLHVSNILAQSSFIN